MSEGYYESYDDEPVELEDVIAQAVDDAVADKLGPLAEAPEQQDDWVTEAEARWEAEDAERDEAEREAQAWEDAEREALMRVAGACEAAGITDPRIAVDVYETVNGLLDDPQFQRQHRDPDHLVEAAIREGVRLVQAPAEGEDEVGMAKSTWAAKRHGLGSRDCEQASPTAVLGGCTRVRRPATRDDAGREARSPGSVRDRMSPAAKTPGLGQLVCAAAAHHLASKEHGARMDTIAAMAWETIVSELLARDPRFVVVPGGGVELANGRDARHKAMSLG